MVSALRSLQEQGFEAPVVARQLGQMLRDKIVGDTSTLPQELALRLLAALVDVPASRDPHTSLEIALLDVALAGNPPAPAAEPKTMREEVRVKPATQVEPHPSTFQKTTKTGPTPKPETAIKSSKTDSKPLDGDAWKQALDQIKKKHNTLYSIIRTTRPLINKDDVTLECAYAFHKKRLNESRNKQIVAETLQAITGQEISIHIAMAEGPLPPPPDDSEVVHSMKEKPKDDQTVKNISNIFGGAELLES